MRGFMNQSVAWVVAAISSTVIVGGGFYGMGKFGAHRGSGGHGSDHGADHGEGHAEGHGHGEAHAAPEHGESHANPKAHGDEHHGNDEHAKDDGHGKKDAHHGEDKATAEHDDNHAHGDAAHAPSTDSGHDQVDSHGEKQEDAHHADKKHDGAADGHHEDKAHKKDGASNEEHGTSMHGNVAWTYGGEKGQSNWGSLSPQYSKCETGTQQSPIDFKSVTPSGSAANIQFVYHDTDVEWTNDGHGVRAKVTEGNYIKVGSKRFNLSEIRFRTPSEHTDHGQVFAGELQFVHHDARGHAGIIGVFVKAGDENDVLIDLLMKVPAAGKPSMRVSNLRLERMFPASQDYYSYEGSFTEPPCAEGVTWMVMRKAIEVSSKQLARLTDAIHEPNARTVQAVHGRKPKVVGIEAVAH
jgi:carbonic anhydrase